MFCFTFVSDHNTDFFNVVFFSVIEHVQLSE